MNLLWLACALMAPPAPVLTVDSATADRGDVRAGPILKQTFRITNSGAETVTVAGLDSGCGCLRRAVSKTELPPGATADVSLDVNTLTQPDGPQTWRLTLRYRSAAAARTDPDQRLDLQVRARLVREVSVTPPMISVSTDAAATATIRVADARKSPFTVKTVTATSQYLVPKVSGKDGQFTVQLAIAGDLPDGTHDETVIVTTDDAHYSELQIPARIVKRGKDAVSAFPAALDLDETDRGIVQFRRGDGKSVAIASATCGAAGVTVTASKGSGAVATVKVAVSGARGKADVTVKFAEPAGAVLTVPVRWGN